MLNFRLLSLASSVKAAGYKKMKRFYKDVTVEASESGYQICLDGRPVRSPAKAVIVVPTQALAEPVQTDGRRLKTKFSQKICLFIQWLLQ